MLYLLPLVLLGSSSGTIFEVGSLISIVEGGQSALIVDVAEVHMQFLYPYLTLLLVLIYDYYVGFERFQGLDFDHAI